MQMASYHTRLSLAQIKSYTLSLGSQIPGPMKRRLTFVEQREMHRLHN